MNSKKCFTFMLIILDEMQLLLSDLLVDSKDERINRIRIGITLLEEQLHTLEPKESGNA